LDSVHRAAGAVFTEFGGWDLPLRFGSELAEHHAVRAAAGLFDLSHMTQIALEGPAAGDGLDHALLGQHSTMSEGRASYSMLLAEGGGVIDDLIVYRLAPERFFVVANAANHGVVLAELTARLADFGVVPVDLTPTRTLLAVQGPKATAILLAAGASEAAALGYYRAVETTLGGWPVILARTGYTGENGFEISAPSAAAAPLWSALLAAGGPFGLVPVGLAARDTLRLEAAMPLYGHELDLDTTPEEGGQGAFVRAKSGDFVGKAALAARAPRKSLIGLAGDGRRAARAGYPVLIDGVTRGRVTSGALSPTLGHPIALASVTGAAPPVGAAVEVDIRGRLTPFRVVPLPFHTKEKP
jgi:aminomethyltransferase